MRMQTVPLPALKANRTAWISADWSQDGKTLLILVRNMSAKQGFDYFAYHLATRRIETLSGHYDRRMSRHEFRRGEQAIPAHEDIRPRSEMGNRSDWSPGRGWYAHVDNREDGLLNLLVTSKEGVTKPVAAGRYDHCAGDTLMISGWLDERYLVYRNAMNYSIFDAQTGTTADLFRENDMPMTFTW